MKSRILKYAFALAACLAALASCRKPEPENKVPVFPTEVINQTVTPGESVEIAFEPNMAWVLSISGDGSGNYFWIDDAGMKATTVSGKADGRIVVKVVFSDDEEFDKNRVCDVTLTMGTESKKIATITRLALNRTLETYAGVAGEYEFTEEFSQETFTEAELVTFAGITDYTLPVRVVSNYPWEIVLPSWLKAVNLDDMSEVAEGGPGTTDLLLTAVISNKVISGQEANVRFIDKNNVGASNEVKIVLPDVSSRLEHEINSTQFNKEGHVLLPSGSYVEGTAVAYVLAVKGMTAMSVEWLGEYYDIKEADWVNIEIGEYYEDASPLQVIDVTVGVDANQGEVRYADLFFFPVSMGEVSIDDIFTDDGSAIKPGFEQYCAGRLVQEGDRPSYIIPVSSKELRDEVGVYFSVLDPKGDDNVMQWDFPDLAYYHKITYTCDYSHEEAEFECTKPYAYVKLYNDTDYPYGVFSEEASDCWISFTALGEENNRGVFTINYTPSSVTHTAAVFYDADDNVIAAVLVVYDPEYTGDGSDMMYAVSSGVAKISKMSKDSELYMAINGNYNVKDVYEIVTNDQMLYVTGTEEFYSAFAIDPATFGDYSGKISVEGASPNFYVYTKACTAKDEVVVVFQTLGADGESMLNMSAVHIVFDPDAEIETEAPFQFVYPDYVGGMATLEKHSGEYADMIIAEWGASQAPRHIYLLTYTDPSVSSIAVVKVPGKPMGGAANNNYDPTTGDVYADYWLTHEQEGDQMTIFMSEAGKVDYFLFTDPTGLPTYALVCTMVLPE